MKYLAAFASMALLTVGPSFAAPIVHPGDTLGVDVLNYASVIDD